MLLETALALLLLLPQDPVRVQASLTASRVAAGNSTILVITVETGGEAPDDVPVPVLPPGLDIGPVSDFSQLQVAFPGGRRRVTRREVVLLARAPGVYRIPAVVVTVANRPYSTRPLQLVVGAGPRGAVLRGSADAVRLRVWATPDSAFVGEQVLYQVEAVFPQELRLRQARPPNFQPPAVTGFWSYDLPEPITVNLRMVEGEAAEIQNFRQVLFPLTDGTQVVPPAHLQLETRQGLVFTPETRTLSTRPVTVHVRPLPDGAPPAFTGAVGRYSIAAAVSPSRSAPGEPVTLRVTLEGSGNIKALTRPALPPIAGVDVYSGGERIEIGFADGTVSGQKQFEWTLVPRGNGRVQVPAIEYSWFDPATRSYETARTASLQLAVSGPALPGPGDSALAPLRPEPAPAPLAWTASPAFAAAQLLPPLALWAGWLARRRRRRQRAEGNADDELDLQRAAALLHDPRACLEVLAIWLRRRQPTPSVTALRDQVRRALYAPTPPDPAECEALWRAARRLADAEPGVNGQPVIVLLLLWWLAAAVQLPTADAFSRGVAAYARGDYGDAAHAFTAHVERAPEDVAGWYDLGNAWAKAGEPGRATWAWLRTLELRPRDQWARHNLRVTAGGAAAEAFAPTVRLSRGELSLAAALLWWIAAGIAWLALSWRRPALGWATAAALVLLLPLLLLLLAREFRPERGVTLIPASLKSAPALLAEPLAELAHGAPLVVLEHRGDWVLARSLDLREGWVERASLGRL